MRGTVKLGYRRLALAVLGVGSLALVAAGCGEGEARSHEELGIPEGAPVIDQDNISFEPNELTVSAGETVYFVNSETTVHNVAIDGEDVTGMMKKFDVREYIFEEPGEYDLKCDYHPQMRATVTVE